MRLLSLPAFLLFGALTEARQPRVVRYSTSSSTDSVLAYARDCTEIEALRECLSLNEDVQIEEIEACFTDTGCNLAKTISFDEFAERWRQELTERSRKRRDSQGLGPRQDTSTSSAGDAASTTESESAAATTEDASTTVTSEESETSSTSSSTEEVTTTTSTTSTEASTTSEDTSTTATEASTTATEATTTTTAQTSASSTFATSTTYTSETETSATSTKIGATCFSTTVIPTSYCSELVTNGNTQTGSCSSANYTSSTCSPGLICTTESTSGYDICMASESFGVPGGVIAACFGVAIALCIGNLIFMCQKDKRAQTKEAQRLLAKKSAS